MADIFRVRERFSCSLTLNQRNGDHILETETNDTKLSPLSKEGTS